MTKHVFGGWLQGPKDQPVAQSFDSVVKPGASIQITGQHIIHDGVPVFYQRMSDCVANATAGALQMVKYLSDPSKAEPLSRNFIYYNARSYSGDTQQDAGCYIHLALQSVERLGVCSDKTEPYSLDYRKKPGFMAYREADSSHLNKIENFYQITSSGDKRVEDVALAIKNNTPVIFGTTVFSDFMDFDGNTEKVFQYGGGTALGGHAMVIMGVAPDNNKPGKLKFFLRNSWGTAWGLNGYAWIGEDYLKHPDTSDLFVITQTPNILFG